MAVPFNGEDGAHPRSRGENGTVEVAAWLDGGSSPLTRGKLDRRGCLEGLAGLIPAHAGKTSCCSPGRSPCGAHPRSRGENLCEVEDADAPAGSSPLTRGKHVGWLSEDGMGRLIPAHAGKTHPTRHQRRTAWAHPRSRGENGTRSDLAYVTEGSSPLTRGKLRGGRHLDLDTGLIPAHAGKTGDGPGLVGHVEAHPRSRGENQRSMVTKGLAGGSSPLTRGKPASRAAGQRVAGLIPAHAGKTSAPR